MNTQPKTPKLPINPNTTINGTENNDTLNGTTGGNNIYGFGGNDVLKGDAGNDLLDGGNGDDTLDGGDDTDTLRGQLGNDTLVGGSGSDVMEGNDGNDSLNGGDGDDLLSGGAGDDKLAGSAGTDVLNGGDGNDTAVYSTVNFADAGIDWLATTDAPLGYAVVTTTEGTDTLTSIETIQFKDKTVQTGNSEFKVNSYTSNNQSWSNITTLLDGGFVAIWQSNGQDSSSWGVYGQRYAVNGEKLGNEFKINTYTSGDQSQASITSLAEGGFVVAWYSYAQDGSDFGVYAQRYNSNGEAVGKEFQLNTYTNSAQAIPSIAGLNDGGFIATWHSSGQDASSWGVYGQRFGADGSKIGTEFGINSYTSSDQSGPSIAGLADGSFIVTWSSYQDGSEFGIYGQHYAANGLKLGAEFKINTYTSRTQSASNVTALVDGGFMVTWQSYNQDGSGWGAYGQRFDASGKAIGDELLISTTTTGDQSDPFVTTLADGGFVVAWQSKDQDGSDWGVYGQRFDADGLPVGSEFRINTYINGDQSQPRVTGLFDGGFVVSWHSGNAQDGNDYGIYAQRFDANGNKIPLTQTNALPTGDVTITGKLTEGQTLTVGNTLADADGLSGAITYQWQADNTIVGTGKTYTLTTADVDKTITVTASYTDDNGTAESKASLPTDAVNPLPPTAITVTSTDDLITGENGDAAHFNVVLTSQPARDVAITFVSSDKTEGALTHPTLTFTSNNWSTPQVLEIKGVDDVLEDKTVAYSVNAAINSLDINYKNITLAPLNLTNTDNEDVIYGDQGGAKQDVLKEFDGNDRLYGQAMADDLSGGIGDDVLYGGYDNDLLFGEDGNDILYGQEDNDRLEGGNGKDTLDGGSGIDTMIGGAGNDTYYLGYDAKDVVTDNGLPSDIDTIIMPYQLTSYTLPKGIEKGTIAAGTEASNLTGNTSNNALTGNEGNNILNGAVGRDSLFGGSGDDVLLGGTGNDILSGGAGADIFKFDAALTANSDKITDFVVADDTIQLDHAVFTKLTTTGVLNINNFVSATKAVDSNDYLVYNKATGALFYDADGSGTSADGIQIALLGVNLALTNADFFVI